MALELFAERLQEIRATLTAGSADRNDLRGRLDTLAGEFASFRSDVISKHREYDDKHDGYDHEHSVVWDFAKPVIKALLIGFVMWLAWLLLQLYPLFKK